MYNLSIGDVISVIELLEKALEICFTNNTKAKDDCESSINFIKTLQTLLLKIESELRRSAHESPGVLHFYLSSSPLQS